MGKQKPNQHQTAAIDLIKSQVPADVPPGYSAETKGADKRASVWVKRMSRWSKDLNANALAYYNYHAHRKTGQITNKRRKPRRVLSSEGFPPSVTVTYVYPPPFSFRTEPGVRDIRHFVVHSMGHGWHAAREKKPVSGWLNTRTRGRGLLQHTFAPPYIYLPKGTTNTKTMAHYERFSRGARTLLQSAALSTAHFMIDRDGNLIVVGDVNDIMYTSVAMNPSSVGVELEEAFYADRDTTGNPVTFKYGGNPPGTNGTVKFWPYSKKQMITLAIVIRKMETMYPSLKQRNLSFREGSDSPKTSPPGYTTHGWIIPKNHLDTSPHFQTKKEWKQLFRLVDKQDQITKHNCFRPATFSGVPPDDIEQVQPLAAEPLTAVTELVYNAAKETGLALDRAFNLFNSTKGSASANAGKGAARASSRISRQAAVMIGTAFKTQNPIIELPKQSTQLGSDGFPAGFDDMWSSTP